MPLAHRHKPRLRLRTILLIVNFFVLVVPLGSIYFFRLYENELIHQTEGELIAQGAYIAALYKNALFPLLDNPKNYGIATQAAQVKIDEKYRPVTPALDLAAATLHPPRPAAAEPAGIEADAYALRAGAAIAPVLEEATLTTLAGVRVVDFQGLVVAGRDEMQKSLLPSEEVATALKGKYAALLRARHSKHDLPPLASISRGTGLRVFVAMPILYDDRVIGAVLLSRSPRNILKGIYDNRRSVMIASLIIVGMVALLAWLTSYAIGRPIHALMAQTQRVARGEKNIHPIGEPVTQELALLSQNIASMADTIAERSDYIRNFAMHVSHEFKTPLTAIQGAVELIQEHGSSMKPEQFQRFLANTMKDTARLKQLVSRLLELARADVLQPREEHTALSALIGALQGEFRDKGMEVTSPVATDILLPLPEDIAHTIMANLLENSRQHGASAVKITASVAEDMLQLAVEDNGKGISTANAAKLFIPFFTTKREQGGTGLGLVIVRSLLHAYKAEIICQPAETGAAFLITVPLR